MTTIQRGPPEVDFEGVPIGTGERLSWELGTEGVGGVFVPENLSGRVAEIVFKPGSSGQTVLSLSVDGPAGRVSYVLPDSFRKEILYLILVEETPGGRKAPRVMGKIKPGVTVTS